MGIVKKVLVRIGLLPEFIDSVKGKKVFLARNASVISSAIGKYTSIGRNTKINNAKIGSFCSISYDTVIGATAHPMNFLSTHAFAYKKRYNFVNESLKFDLSVNIGSDVWIGTHVVILPGISIGNGSIIGAGSIVTKDVPDYAIVVGSPAKVINYRFSKEIIKHLLDIKWWSKSDQFIKNHIDVFIHELKSIDQLKPLSE